MKHTFFLTALALSAAVAGAGPAGAAAMGGPDAAFVTQAAQAGMAEVKAADLALSKSKNPRVIAFAKRMQTDHSKANAQLMMIANAQGFALPSGIGAKNGMQLSKLKSESGATFDTDYLNGQLTAHEQAVALFRSESKDGTNAAVAAFAKQTLPTLEAHLAMDERDVAALGSRGRHLSM